MFEMVCAGLYEIPFRYGWAAMQRLLKSVSLSKHEEQGSKAGQPTSDAREKIDFITLERMVVKPKYQGKGYGSQALREILAATEGDASIIPTSHQRIHLSTQDDRNVTFYRRLGFEVVNESDIVDTETSDPSYYFHNWDMYANVHEVREHLRSK
eukprot:CAMPEP_0168729510 /NCGR_PEP_ID=MMETSP0724-20121128/6241_1 /TAXON_ID=265536 /ORGANISM="Amphiprora sp., Strain CCMP467" /LENGTH=153 /DNA_ID=CAMNT_0008776397 /DNA_START=316 /DNA_END=777 /DNA_ORIENTATION=+